MGILSPLVLSMAFLLSVIELSSQFDHLPDGAPVSGTPRIGTAYSPTRYSHPPRSRSRSPRPEIDPAGFHHARLPPVEYDPAWFPPSEFDPAGFHPDEFPEVRFHPDEFQEVRFHHVRASAPNKPPNRPPSPDRSSPPRPSPPEYSPVRSMVPPTRLPSYDKRGCGMEELKLIRLTSRFNFQRVFELRRYTFPADSGLKVRLRDRQYEPVPTHEQIVMSTFDGEVYAILRSTNVLAGMFLLFDKRAKINMQTGIVTLLTQNEIKETPVGPTRPILKFFDVKQVKNE